MPETHAAMPARALAILLMAAVVFFNACGIKGPPVPPQQPPMTPVTDLKAVVDDGAVVLTWGLQADENNISGYYIYRARFDADKPPCTDCPIPFVSDGTLSVNHPGEQHRFVTQAAPGFRYLFKVKPFRAFGPIGPDSNVVEVVVP